MHLSPLFFRWHRWLAWLVAVQVALWVLGGLVFAWVPFQAWVKSADDVARPSLTLPADWTQRLAASPALPAAPLQSVSSAMTALGPAWKLRHAGGETWLLADGQAMPPPDEAAVRRYAATLYRGQGALQSVERLGEAPLRLLMVREVGERRGLWVVRFDDRLKTRLYFDGRSGEFITARNEAWVVYDFFWRLHVMDYHGGEDFNNTLLRVAALAAVALVGTGGVLLVLSGRRAWRRRQKHAQD